VAPVSTQERRSDSRRQGRQQDRQNNRYPGNTKGGKNHCTLDLLLDWFGSVCFANKNKIVSCHTADSKPVKQEVNGTVILPPLVFPAGIHIKKPPLTLRQNELECFALKSSVCLV